MEDWISLGYLLSAALFIFGLKKLGHPRTAPFGNQLGALGMLVAVVTTILQMGLGDGIEWVLIGAGLVIGSLIGLWMAIRVEMTGMPELVALFNGFGGAASALVALSEVWRYIEDPSNVPTDQLEITVIMVAAGLVCTRRMDDTHRFPSRYVQTQGRCEHFRKVDKNSNMGPSLAEPSEGNDGRWSCCSHLPQHRCTNR